METKEIFKATNLQSWVKSAVISKILGEYSSFVKLEVKYLEGGIEFPFASFYPNERSAKISFAKRFHGSVRWAAKVDGDA